MHKGLIFVDGKHKPYEYRDFPGWFNGKIYKTEAEYRKDFPKKEESHTSGKKKLKFDME